MVIRTVQATRYVTPLREGGSLPAIVEADDDGLYVLKFRGAGQGPLALVAELVGGEIGRLIGAPVPEIVFIHVDPALGRNEPDQEIRQLLTASVGLNVGLDYLPGSLAFDPVVSTTVPAPIASTIVWLDAFITNVDRTAKNTNLLWWHKALYCIDHGAAMYFHHDWPETPEALAHSARNPFRPIRDHVLLGFASQIEAVATRARAALIPERVIQDIVAQIPDVWLVPGDPGMLRDKYLSYFNTRIEADHFVQEAVRAHSVLV